MEALDSHASGLAAFLDRVLASGCTMPASLTEREADEVAPLSIDHVYGEGGGADVGGSAPMVVLYAPLGSAAFRAAHGPLSAASSAGSISYVYRPHVRAAAGART